MFPPDPTPLLAHAPVLAIERVKDAVPPAAAHDFAKITALARAAATLRG
ncbi:MAG: hypothetical protein WD073_06840 [Xanthobacteraceae bacterium]